MRNKTLIPTLLLSFAAAVSHGQESPFNRVVVILDDSGSFAVHFEAARDIAWRYVKRMANVSPKDEVYVIAADNNPRVIAYVRGVRSRRDAETEFDKAFKDVSPGVGTDYFGAYKLAHFYLTRKPTAAATHLLAFGDHCVDPVKDEVTHKLIKNFPPLSEVPWGQFQGTAMNLFFVDEAVRQELDAIPSFSVLNASVSGIETDAKTIKLDPPKRIKGSTADGGLDSGLMAGFGLLAVLGVVALVVTRIPRRS